MKRILIATASNWPSTAALPRLFARAGSHVTVLCHPNAMIVRSRFVAEHVPAPGGLRGTIEALREHLAEATYDHVIAGDDPFIGALLCEPQREWLRPWMPFDPDDANATGFAVSKHAFLTIGQAAGVPVADFALCTSAADVASAVRRFGLPLVLKEETGHAGGTVHRIDTEADATRVWESCGGRTLAAQRFVHGTVATIEALWRDGVPHCYMGAYKVDCHPSDFGAASAKQPFRHPALEPIVSAVGALTRYTGVGAIDVIAEHATGRFYVSELNPRPSGGGFILTERIASGFARHWQAFLRGEAPVGVPADLGYRSAPVPLFPNNWYYFVERARKAEPRAWLRAAEAFARAPYDDPPLCAAYFRVFAGYLAGRSRGGTVLKRAVKRAFRLRSAPHPGAH